MSMSDIYDDRFKCCVQRLEYDFTSRTGLLVMNEHDCTDMSGCIKVFEGIDPEVKLIRTIEASGRPDTTYRKLADGWKAFVPA
jgi:hypothetical protein